MRTSEKKTPTLLVSTTATPIARTKTHAATPLDHLERTVGTTAPISTPKKKALDVAAAERALKFSDRPRALWEIAQACIASPHERGASFTKLARFVDGRGVFDVLKFLREHPKNGARIVDRLVRRTARSADVFGPSEGRQETLVRMLDELKLTSPRIARALVKGIWQIPERLPAIDLVVADFKAQAKNEKPFANHLVFGVQHLLSTQAPLFSALEELGAKAEDIHLLGIPYSTSPLVAWYFKQRGYQVKPGAAANYDGDNGQHRFHQQRMREVRESVRELIKKAKHTGKKILVLDDGGLVSSCVAKHYPKSAHRFCFVEQTTRGITEVERVQLRSPLIDVARTKGKELEPPFVADAAIQALLGELRSVGLVEHKGVRLTLNGFGRVGSAVARRLKDIGFDVTIVETDDANGRARLELAKSEGFRTSTDLLSVMAETQVLLGGSGHPSVFCRALELLPVGAVVGSLSSAEAEIVMNELRDRAFAIGEDSRDRLGPRFLNMAGRAGGTVSSLRTGFGREYAIGYRPPQRFTPHIRRGETREHVFNGKSLIILKDGRPLNFDGKLENVEPEYIQVTRGLMLLGALRAVQTKAHGITPLPDADQTRLIELMQQRWAQHEPAKRRPQRIKDELAALSEVFPRTSNARADVRVVAFRDATGTLRARIKERGGEQELVLPVLAGTLVSARECRRGTIAVCMRDGAALTEHWIRGDEIIHSRPVVDELVGFAHGDRYRTFERRGDQLFMYQLDNSGLTTRAAPLPHTARSASIFELEYVKKGIEELDNGLQGLAPEEIGLIQAVRQPPAIFVWDLALTKSTALPLPRELASIERVVTSELNGSACVLGRDTDGRLSYTIVELQERSATPLARLPEGAELKWFFYDGRSQQNAWRTFRDHWEIGFRPLGARDEEGYYERLKIPRGKNSSIESDKARARAAIVAIGGDAYFLHRHERAGVFEALEVLREQLRKKEISLPPDVAIAVRGFDAREVIRYTKRERDRFRRHAFGERMERLFDQATKRPKSAIAQASLREIAHVFLRRTDDVAYVSDGMDVLADALEILETKSVQVALGAKDVAGLVAALTGKKKLAKAQKKAERGRNIIRIAARTPDLRPAPPERIRPVRAPMRSSALRSSSSPRAPDAPTSARPVPHVRRPLAFDLSAETFLVAEYDRLGLFRAIDALDGKELDSKLRQRVRSFDRREVIRYTRRDRARMVKQVSRADDVVTHRRDTLERDLFRLARSVDRDQPIDSSAVTRHARKLTRATDTRLVADILEVAEQAITLLSDPALLRALKVSDVWAAIDCLDPDREKSAAAMHTRALAGRELLQQLATHETPKKSICRRYLK